MLDNITFLKTVVDRAQSTGPSHNNRPHSLWNEWNARALPTAGTASALKLQGPRGGRVRDYSNIKLLFMVIVRAWLKRVRTVEQFDK